ncbi:MAG: hydrogenase maturation protease [Burkholderiales bacterium]|nr:MAG: hydrogenase maturation protease [Burkholderiales bacterium]
MSTDRATGAGIVVVALGNRLRGDDAIGAAVLERLAPRAPPTVRLDASAGDPLSLLGAFEDSRALFVVDAVRSGAAAGSVRRLDLAACAPPPALARASSHGPGLAAAIALGRQLGTLPPVLVCYAVEAARFEHGAPLSPQVAAAVEPVVERLLAEIAALAAAVPDALSAGGARRAG